MGIGSTERQIIPIQVGADANWVEASAGPYWSIGKKADGSIWAWGDIGGTADPYVRVPTRVGTDNDWLSAVAGSDYSLAVKTDGRVFACGNTDLTSGGTTTNGGGVLIQDRFTAIHDGETNRTDSSWTEAGWTNGLAAYRRKMAAIGSNGSLRIWGDAFGDYPRDSRTNLPVPIPDDLDANRPWWDPERYEPGVLTLPGPWVSVTGNSGTTDEGDRAGGNTLPAGFAAAVRGNGSLWVWGANSNGQLGDGTRIPKDLPVKIGAGTNWLKVEAGGRHVLALQKDGSVWAWGNNDRGQLGAKATNLVSLQYNSNLISVVTNKTYDIRFAPVRVTTNTTTNWELTPYTLSTLNFDTNVVEPRNVLPASWGAREISAGGKNSLILKKDGTLWELGKGPTSPVTLSITSGSTFPQVVKVITNIKVAPVQILRFTNFQSAVLDQTSNNQIQNVTTNGWRWKSGPFSFSAGDRHNLAVRADGFLCSWGENDSAQLGNGNLQGTSQPTAVGAGNRWRKVFAGKEHSLAIKDNGSLWAWGLNDGRLGLPFATAKTFYDPSKIEFGPAGLATLTLENGKAGTERISGQGLAAFLPASGQAAFSAQVVEGILGPLRAQWEGEAQYRFIGRRLVFSNAYLSFLVSNTSSTNIGSIGVTNTNSIPREAFVRLEWGALERSATNPAFFEGEARFVWTDPYSYSPPLPVADRYDRLKPKNGKICRISLLFDEDQDGDGVPDMADSAFQGTPPVITSTNRLNLRVASSDGLPYRITTKPDTNSGAMEILANEDLSALPDGLGYTSDGFTGFPTEAAVGRWEVVIGARNNAGESYQTVVVNVPPVITSPDLWEWTPGVADFEYQITATTNNTEKFPIAYSAANLPAGLSVNPTNGWIRPTKSGQTNVPGPGLYRWSLVASNAGGATTRAVEVRVAPPGSGEWIAGAPVAYAVNLAPGATYAVSGLPSGLSFNPGKGLITGTPLMAGAHEVEIVSRTRTATNTNRISFPVRLGRPEIVGSSSLSFTGATSLRQNRFFRYQLSARSAGQPWAGASDFTEALSKQWTNQSGSYGRWNATSGTLRYSWTNTNAASASLDWSQPLPLDSAWQVSVNAAFSTSNLSGILQGEEYLTAMLLALRDRSSNSAASNFLSVYLEGATNANTGMVVAEAVVDGLPNGAVGETVMEGRSALSFVYQPATRDAVARADEGNTNLVWGDFQTNNLTTWTNAAKTNGLVLRLMGQSKAPTNRGVLPYFSRFVVSPLGDLSYSSTNLPPGLFLDSASGLIYGAPTAKTNLQSSIIVISNTLGSASLTIRFSVQ